MPYGPGHGRRPAGRSKAFDPWSRQTPTSKVATCSRRRRRPARRVQSPGGASDTDLPRKKYEVDVRINKVLRKCKCATNGVRSIPRLASRVLFVKQREGRRLLFAWFFYCAISTAPRKWPPAARGGQTFRQPACRHMRTLTFGCQGVCGDRGAALHPAQLRTTLH